MNLYPRSLLRLILLGWVVTALPLLVAIAFASLSITRITERSEAAVQQAAQTAKLGWELEEDLFQMERLLRQFELLRTQTLQDDYVAARIEWRQDWQRFSAIPLLAPLNEQIGGLLYDEVTAHNTYVATGEAQPLIAVLEKLAGTTHEVNLKANQLADSERQSFSVAAEAIRKQMLYSLAAAILLAVILFWLGRRIIAQLLNRVERAVIVLGNNMLDRRIRFSGPEDLQQIGRRLDWLRRRLRSLEEERTRILRHISHELKTPLAALREGASLLSEGVAGPLTPQQTKIAGIMQGNSLRLQGLIDGLLQLQQAEHVRGRIVPVPLRLDEMIQHALATHRLAARNKKLRITGTLAPLTVAGGHEEVTTIVNNMISNAIKFSPEGSTVRMSLTREGNHAALDVIDEGPGVPEDEREKIFEPFYRTAESKSIAGVGLGLAISREFAKAHRGSLDLLATSSGAHFRTTLPLAEEPA